MSKTKKYLALDLGAESGRGILGHFDGEKITLEVLHRFPNGGVQIRDRLHWNILGLWAEIKNTLAICAKNHGEIESVGVDTWGVDYGLIGENGDLIGLPFHYRDRRTEGVMEKVFDCISRREIFENTGIQFISLNTLYQIYSMVIEKSPILTNVKTFLTIPDLLNFWLTDRKVCEFTNATTTQLFDPRQQNWSKVICDALEIPLEIFPEIIYPGTEIGKILPSIRNETGISEISVIAPACHDTGSAVAAVPAICENWAYISSGTWSLMGIEIENPIINDLALDLNFTNEGGVNGTYRFLKNIAGLWLIQECRRTWARSGDKMSYDQITQIAENSTPFKAIIDPDHDSFLTAGDMPSRIADFCRRTDQAIPQTKGEIVRCALESLALKYRSVFENLEKIRGDRIDTIHIVGGGTQNRLLCQFTADATKRTVIAGPIEATAIGNIAVQIIASGEIDSLSDAREIIAKTAKTEIYQPKNSDRWDHAYENFLAIHSNESVV